MRDWDLYSLVVISFLTALLAHLFPDNPLRIALGLTFVLFFPGYALVCFLFPEKSLDNLERLALSFGLSIAVVPLIGLLLNYTTGIRLEAILLAVFAFNTAFSLAAIYRRSKALDPWVPELKKIGEALEWSKSSRLDKILTILLLLAIFASIATLVYLVANPRQGESFTEFYILGPRGKASDYPTKFFVNQNVSVILGIANREQREVKYIVEVWLVDMSYEGNETVIKSMRFMDRLEVTLPHKPIEMNWTPQWENFYNFSIDRPGKYKIFFLLFKDFAPPLPFEPERMKEFANTEAEERIKGAISGSVQSLILNVEVREI